LHGKQRFRRDTAGTVSVESVEIRNEAVRWFFSAFEGEDDAFRAVLHPEIEWYPIEENRTPTRGVDAALWNRNEWLDTWDEHELTVEDVMEGGDDVVAVVHITAQGHGSGIETNVRFYAQFKVRDDKVVYIYDHEDRAEALEAAGLSE
jgi:ketosteroid isomerase-like protein